MFKTIGNRHKFAILVKIWASCVPQMGLSLYTRHWFLLAQMIPEFHNLYCLLSRPAFGHDCWHNTFNEGIRHWGNKEVVLTLNASSSVQSSPMYIGSTSSELTNPRKDINRCEDQLQLYSEWEGEMMQMMKFHSPRDSSKNSTALPLSQSITGRTSKTWRCNEIHEWLIQKL